MCFAQIKQTAGSYRIQHYGVETYGNHPRNFDVVQNLDGLLYFANAYGVLEFDGENWNHIELQEGRSALSLGVSDSNVVFVGSYNDFGYLEYNKKGVYQYYSLRSLLPDDALNFEEITTVSCLKNKTYFQSKDFIFVYENKSIQIVLPTTQNKTITFFKRIEDELWIQESDGSVFQLHNNILKKIDGTDAKSMHLIAVLRSDDEHLSYVSKQGIYLKQDDLFKEFRASFNQEISHQEITDALFLENGDYLISTLKNGLYIFSPRSGEVKNINLSNGLYSNQVLKVFSDLNGGVWLILDNGIAYIELNSSFQYWGTNTGIRGMGYTGVSYKDHLYVGTSEGVFYSSMKAITHHPTFTKVKNLNEQVWDLKVLNNQLFCCSKSGVYQILKNEIKPIHGKQDFNGNWKMETLNANPNYLIKGSYEGLQLYQFVKNELQYVQRIEGFSESCRVFTQDKHGNVWVCHGNKGLFKIQLSKDYSQVNSVINLNESIELSANGVVHVANLHDTIIVSTQKGIYFWNEADQQLESHFKLNQPLRVNQYINSVFESSNDKVWVFSGNNLELLTLDNSKNYTRIGDPFKKIKSTFVGSYEFVQELLPNQYLIGSQDGFTFCDLSKLSKDSKVFNVVIRKVASENKVDSVLISGGNMNNNSIKWPFELNSLKFTFSSPFYESAQHLTYQYSLKESNEKEEWWSSWNTTSHASFRNLPKGQYVFKARAKNIFGDVSSPVLLSFEILAPWYQTRSAIVFYVVLLLLLMLLVVFFVKRLLNNQQKRLEQKRLREIEHLERKHLNEQLLNDQRIMKIKNENLESEVIRKNNELGNLAETITKKGAMLSRLKTKIESIDLQEPVAIGDLKINQVIKAIDEDLDFSNDWSSFQMHFDQVHDNFLHKLRTQNPKLNQSWLLFCAYIRMNKSNKEIAVSMNISVSAVEKRKARLGSKLSINDDFKPIDYLFML